MSWKFEKEFRKDKPETIGETDRHYDLDNYKDWLEQNLSTLQSEKAELVEMLEKAYKMCDKLQFPSEAELREFVKESKQLLTKIK